MTNEDVVQRPDDRTRKGLDAVTVHDDHVGFPFAHDRAEAIDGSRQDRIHFRAVSVVAEGAHVRETGSRDFDLGASVPIDEMHSRCNDEVLDVVGGGDSAQERLQFAEFGPRRGEKEESFHSPTWSRRNWVLRAIRLVARLPSTFGKSTASNSPVPGRFTHTFE